MEAKSVKQTLNSTCKCNRLGRWHRKGQLVYFPWPFQRSSRRRRWERILTEHQRYQIYALKKAGHAAVHRRDGFGVALDDLSGVAAQSGAARLSSRPSPSQSAGASSPQGEGDQDDGGGHRAHRSGSGQQWSPEQIAGRLATTDGLHLSPQRIYQHIQADRQAGGTLYRHLRHSQKKRKNAMEKPIFSIDQRPAIVEEKSRIGDWEIDLVMGRPRTGALVSVVERRSRYTVKSPPNRPSTWRRPPLRCSRPIRGIPRR